MPAARRAGTRSDRSRRLNRTRPAPAPVVRLAGTGEDERGVDPAGAEQNVFTPSRTSPPSPFTRVAAITLAGDGVRAPETEQRSPAPTAASSRSRTSSGAASAIRSTAFRCPSRIRPTDESAAATARTIAHSSAGDGRSPPGPGTEKPSAPSAASRRKASDGTVARGRGPRRRPRSRSSASPSSRSTAGEGTVRLARAGDLERVSTAEAGTRARRRLNRVADRLEAQSGLPGEACEGLDQAHRLIAAGSQGPRAEAIVRAARWPPSGGPERHSTASPRPNPRASRGCRRSSCRALARAQRPALPSMAPAAPMGSSRDAPRCRGHAGRRSRPPSQRLPPRASAPRGGHALRSESDLVAGCGDLTQ